ncbi:hypothetical protein [Streptomyces candidus]|uniref:DUF308 domain-containing protein n=1 Tax=Streptomyces candidus TaxID=67283 RepID=A0A7X0H9X9_9ACTN|nr:hypothetical protein [Streptomyces candidus]MBB6433772.1 hypothetical protein [Streptomyces candidus]GHH34643.1 hypothetical protein GCM10018773_07070 [Streptomyces candidus]
MAEHNAERADREEEREPEAVTGGHKDDAAVPLDESAVWEAIVAGYGEEPPDPPGAKPFKSVDDLARLEGGVNGDAPAAEPGPVEDDRPVGSSVIFAPGVGMAGPRDFSPAEAKDEDLDESDEGHFVPPDPDLPEADVTSRFAWLAVIGGPLLLLVAVLFSWDMTWWLQVLGIGGFLGGFATLVARMSHGSDEEDEDPGRGAVV